MSSSAFSTDPGPNRRGFDRLDRTIARLLVLVLFATTPGSALAGDEFDDANRTNFDDTVVTLDNSQAGQTTFSIDTSSTTIEWQDLQQPADNTLQFEFSDPNSIVLNDIGAQHPSHLNGTVLSNGTVAFANPFGVFIGDDAVIDVGSLVAIGGSVSRDAFLTSDAMLLPLTGSIENDGTIIADGNVALLGRNVVNRGEISSRGGHILAIAGHELGLQDWNGVTAEFRGPGNFLESLATDTVTNHGSIDARSASLLGARVVNFGEIEIADDSLMMVGADSVWVTRFDDPILIRVPNLGPEAAQTASDLAGETQYAVENHGRIDAGLGHVRIAASDPLGFAIRQGDGTAEAPASISARRIQIEGGEDGRVHLSGSIDASDRSEAGHGGSIDVTGSMIVLDGAKIDASGTAGGGTIQIGGEQEGRGELQRARVVYVDEESEIRADAIESGDGGRVIVFAEDLTSVDGEISARGGSESGDGGFVETSGLRHFLITRGPDVSAPRGAAGSWLIDPFNITITNAAPDCPADGVACLNKAIEAILSPDFDDAGFDGILRTVDPADNVANANFVSADLIAAALATGTDVTLSTQAFGVDTGTDDGNIDILDEILITNADTLEGTRATLTLLAAGDINVASRIASVESLAAIDGRANLALSIELRANDLGQIQSDQTFENDLLQGDISIDADIRTGGGDVTLSGASIVQQAGRTLDTDGGSVDIRTGIIDARGIAVTFSRTTSDPAVDPLTAQPRLEIGGIVDTRGRNAGDEGGDIVMIASAISVSTRISGPDLLEILPGQLSLGAASQVFSGGGDVQLSGGSQPTIFGQGFAGSLEVLGDLDSGGGDVTMDAIHVDPEGDNGNFDVSFVDPMLGEGGVIDLELGAGGLTTSGGFVAIGSSSTQSILIDGMIDSRDAAVLDGSENGLVQIIAPDLPGVDGEAGLYGNGEVRIGERSATSILTSGLLIDTRDVAVSDGAGANPVVLSAVGSSTAMPPDLDPDEESVDLATSGDVRITGSRQVVFNQNTEITGEAIDIAAGTRPTELNVPDPPGTSERPDSETRLVFGGTNGAGQTAADGVRLNGDVISISVGDGTTTSGDSFAADLGTAADPTDFGLQRLTTASYSGLQLRSADDTALRPEEIRIAQDADLTITISAAIGDGEIHLAGVFDTATIGSNGMRTTLESSDGVLTIEDAAALNNGPGAMAGSDAEKSFVVLNGGLFLPISPDDPLPSDDTVVLRDGVLALGGGGTAAFDVESLTISTPGNFTITQQVVDSIVASNELVFEAGRLTEGSESAGRGTLSVVAGLVIQAGERLALLAGAAGFGDLVFEGPSTTLSADDLSLRAGAGIDSENSDNSSAARIVGLQGNVAIRDSGGAIFGDAASSATSFSYRQDAAIDGQTDLPDLAQFGLAPATGFRAAGDVAYRVRSDGGNILLDDGLLGTNEGDRFRNAAISFIAVDASGLPAIDVSDEFVFVGKRIELGGVGDFTFTQSLASAFNRSGSDADESITLRAGLDIAGRLAFDRGSESSVLVKAPTIQLVVGNGFELTEEAQFESTIDVRNATFDLAGPVGSDPTFVFHTDSILDLDDLPDANQFLGGNAGLPDVLALRTDLAAIEFDDFDAMQLPLDLTDDPGRLILEAETVSLSRTDGGNLELTSIPNLELRIRTNNLFLIAADDDVGQADAASVLIGPRVGDMQPTVGVDSDFDGESLLIEAFDRDATIATTTNLSVLSADPTTPGQFDLDAGQSPTTITITQDGEVVADELFLRDVVSGRFEKSGTDEVDGTPIPTTYSITANVNPVTVTPENVDGSRLRLRGTADVATDDGITFAGSGGLPGIFDLASLAATTPSSISIADGTQISVAEELSLAVGFLAVEVSDPGTEFGTLSFESGASTTLLAGNKIILTAGPAFVLDLPDDDEDGVPDVDPPYIDFANLDEIRLTGDPAESRLDIKQSATLEMVRGGRGDFLTPLEAGQAGGTWSALILDVVQGNLDIFELDVLATLVDSLTGRNTSDDGTTTVHVPDAAITTTPFDDFAGAVEFDSNDVTFVTTDPNTSINLATDNLALVSFARSTGGVPEDELGRLRGDAEIDDRPIVRIHQAGDFTSTELPRPDQYEVIDERGNRNVRSDLSGLDIELKTTGAGVTLTLDDDLRARVSFSNLILDSAADVEILLDGPTPGFDGLDYAALQLTSLDIKTVDTDVPADGIGDGAIFFRPFMIAGSPEPLTISTSGDQRFDGTVVLDTTVATEGRDIVFRNDVTQVSAPDAGLRIATSGNVGFEADIGSSAAPLDHLWVAFDARESDRTPNVQFGRRDDLDGDGIAETPVDTDQSVHVLSNILFAAYDFASDLTAADVESGLAGITDLPSLEAFLANLGLGRQRTATFATIGKALGDLLLDVSNGHFIMASGEKLSVGGTATIATNPVAGLAALGDVSALALDVDATGIGLVRRRSGVNLDRTGETQQDAGPSISANSIDFDTTVPVMIGSGRSFRFGVPNPFDRTSLPAFLGQFPLFELLPSGSPLDTQSFRFLSTTSPLAAFVPSLRPLGSSRSDLSGAFGPEVEPVPERLIPEAREPVDTEDLIELSIEAIPTPDPVRLARLREAGLIDDLGLGSDSDVVTVTTARLDATDVSDAIALYEQLFGPEGERADEVRAVLQDAVDLYLVNTRARRVIGFELRRFVKNRPSTLFDAYHTLESMDALFRYHRRIGLSPGEYRRIQMEWLRQVQPDGITLDELSEAIHPSRYVRGSDILDIFGR